MEKKEEKEDENPFLKCSCLDYFTRQEIISNY